MWDYFKEHPDVKSQLETAIPLAVSITTFLVKQKQAYGISDEMIKNAEYISTTLPTLYDKGLRYYDEIADCFYQLFTAARALQKEFNESLLPNIQARIPAFISSLILLSEDIARLQLILKAISKSHPRRWPLI